MSKTSVSTNKEFRSLTSTFEMRPNQDGTRSVSGYAARFDSLSKDLGGFRERIQPGAFTSTLKNNPDVRLLANHNWDQPLARVASRTLSLREDGIGLAFSATLPDTSYARDLIVSMERGDVDSMSFGFNCDDDDWTQDASGVTRTLRAVSLAEISIVTNPAYEAASVNLRSAPAEIRSLLSDIFGDDDEDQDEEDCPCGDHDEDGKCTCKDEDEDPDFDERSLAVILARRRIVY